MSRRLVIAGILMFVAALSAATPAAAQGFRFYLGVGFGFGGGHHYPHPYYGYRPYRYAYAPAVYTYIPYRPVTLVRAYYPHRVYRDYPYPARRPGRAYGHYVPRRYTPYVYVGYRR